MPEKFLTIPLLGLYYKPQMVDYMFVGSKTGRSWTFKKAKFRCFPLKEPFKCSC